MAAEQGEQLPVGPVEQQPELGHGPGQVVQRPAGHHPALADDGHPVADGLDLGEQMGVEEHGDPAGGQLPDQLADLAAAHRVEGRGRLVEQDQVGPGEQGQGEAEALGHALGVAADPLAAPPGQADPLQQLGDAPGQLGAAEAGQAAVEVEQLGAGRPLLEAEVLGQVADPAAGGRLGRRPAEDQRLPAGGPDQAEQDLHGGGLAGPVGPEEAEHLPGLDGQGQVVEGDPGPEGLAQAGRGDRRDRAAGPGDRPPPGQPRLSATSCASSEPSTPATPQMCPSRCQSRAWSRPVWSAKLSASAPCTVAGRDRDLVGGDRQGQGGAPVLDRPELGDGLGRAGRAGRARPRGARPGWPRPRWSGRGCRPCRPAGPARRRGPRTAARPPPGPARPAGCRRTARAAGRPAGRGPAGRRGRGRGRR